VSHGPTGSGFGTGPKGRAGPKAGLGERKGGPKKGTRSWRYSGTLYNAGLERKRVARLGLQGRACWLVCLRSRRPPPGTGDTAQVQYTEAATRHRQHSPPPTRPVCRHPYQ
jgi:hypothetical protein